MEIIADGEILDRIATGWRSPRPSHCTSPIVGDVFGYMGNPLGRVGGALNGEGTTFMMDVRYTLRVGWSWVVLAACMLYMGDKLVQTHHMI